MVEDPFSQRARGDEGCIIGANRERAPRLLMKLIVIGKERHRFRAKIHEILDDDVDLFRSIALLEPLDLLRAVPPMRVFDVILPMILGFVEAQGR